MKPNDDNNAVARRRRLLQVALVLLAAVVVGLPTLRGTFVGGDDHRLVLNHVLVNHPSLSHAGKLFTIIHRDLYQPLPLLSFSLEFAIAGWFGLFDEGLSGGAWLFHMTNIILHAVNALLVWAVIVTWRARPGEDGLAPAWKRDTGGSAYGIATIAALLFAIHPLQVEVVAWVNGRMMLLSTMFALASALCLGVWLRDRRLRWAIATVLCVLACGMSKIRVGLPLILILLPLVQGRKVTARLIVLWLVSAAITGVLVIVNVMATAGAGMFEGAAEQLHGSRIARALMALAWYLQHFVWPTGLAAWYPTPGTVHWSDAAVLRAVAIVLPCLAVMVWAARRSRVAVLGFGWFFLTMASTLPLVPTRNALAADRYMYLPIVGLLWVVGLAAWKLYGISAARWRARWVGLTVAPVAAALMVALIAQSRHTASFYDSFLKKTLRIATLFPNTAYAWERVAWAHHSLGQYEEAIATARKEFAHDDDKVRSDAHVVIGTSQLKLGRSDAAIESLRRAVELNPAGLMTKYRLATALDDLGRVNEAMPLYERAMSSLRMFNPGINRLAEVYRRLGRPADAGRMYARALENNPYDVTATLGLAELDVESGTRQAYLQAELRLTKLLDWMPENATARVNLGVVRAGLGRTGEAIEAYERVLAQRPVGKTVTTGEGRDQLTAALNLAQLYQSAGDVERARPLFERAAAGGVESIDQAIGVHDFFVAQHVPARAVQLWSDFVERFPDSVEARSFAAWSKALAGDLDRARAEANTLIEQGHEPVLVTATLAYVALVEDRYNVATDKTLALCGAGDLGADARRRLLGALEAFDLRRPGVPWTYCLAAQLLIADGRIDPARVFVDLCAQHCGDDPACDKHAQSLRERLD